MAWLGLLFALLVGYDLAVDLSGSAATVLEICGWVIWAVTAVLALQADPVPTSLGGRIAMILGMTIELVVVASLAGVIGSFLVEARRENASATGEAS